MARLLILIKATCKIRVRILEAGRKIEIILIAKVPTIWSDCVIGDGTMNVARAVCVPLFVEAVLVWVLEVVELELCVECFVLQLNPLWNQYQRKCRDTCKGI